MTETEATMEILDCIGTRICDNEDLVEWKFGRLRLYYQKSYTKYPWVADWPPGIFLFNQVPDSWQKGFEFLEKVAEKFPLLARKLAEPM